MCSFAHFASILATAPHHALFPSLQNASPSWPAGWQVSFHPNRFHTRKFCISALAPSRVSTPCKSGNSTILRTYTMTVPAFSVCDIKRDGTTNVADVQSIINEALGVASAANDLNGDGLVNVADVQIVINAALRLGCIAE